MLYSHGTVPLPTCSIWLLMASHSLLSALLHSHPIHGTFGRQRLRLLGRGRGEWRKERISYTTLVLNQLVIMVLWLLCWNNALILSLLWIEFVATCQYFNTQGIISVVQILFSAWVIQLSACLADTSHETGQKSADCTHNPPLSIGISFSFLWNWQPLRTHRVRLFETGSNQLIQVNWPFGIRS